eukprot:g4488.t1
MSPTMICSLFRVTGDQSRACRRPAGGACRAAWAPDTRPRGHVGQAWRCHVVEQLAWFASPCCRSEAATCR